MIKDIKETWKKINKEKLTILGLKTVMVVGIAWSIFNLGFIVGNKVHQDNMERITERYNRNIEELQRMYEEKCEDCKENHWELLRYGVEK